MSTPPMFSRLAWADQDEDSEIDDLEYRQSPHIERTRSVFEGKNARLTELAAAPHPISTEEGYDLETAQSLARSDTRMSRSSGLAEVTAPSPVSENRRASRRSSRRGSDPSSRRASRTYSRDWRPPSRSGASGEEKREHKTNAKLAPSEFWVETQTISWVIFFSFWGTLARLGVEAIATYPYDIVPSTVLWANLGGCFFMGFLLENRVLFRYSTDPQLLEGPTEQVNRHIDAGKKILPLYIGLTTGFCGSFTSFSTFITDAFLALTNALPTSSPTSPYHTISTTAIRPRNGGYSFMATAAILVVHPAVSMSGFKTGAHLAAGLERFTPSLPAKLMRRVLDPLAIFLGFGCWLGAIFLAIWPVSPKWRAIVMALVFSPLGALLRFYLARILNTRVPGFPLGTFATNVFGTIIEGICYDLQHASVVVRNVTSETAVSCAVLEGVMQGFCGCATTVSTWIVELNGLRRGHAWVYGLTSVAVTLGIQVVIMGSVGWSVGFDHTCA